MTLDRRAALVQLASMLKSAHGQLAHIYRAEQEQTGGAGGRHRSRRPGRRHIHPPADPWNWPPRCNSCWLRRKHGKRHLGKRDAEMTNSFLFNGDVGSCTCWRIVNVPALFTSISGGHRRLSSQSRCPSTTAGGSAGF